MYNRYKQIEKNEKIAFIFAFAAIVFLGSCEKDQFRRDVTIVNNTNIYIRNHGKDTVNRPPIDTTHQPTSGAWTGATHQPEGTNSVTGEVTYYVVLADKTFHKVWTRDGQPYVDPDGNSYYDTNPDYGVPASNEMNSAIDAEFAKGNEEVLIWIRVDGSVMYFGIVR